MKELILSIIQSGRIKRLDLLAQLRDRGFDITERQLRATIEDLVTSDKHPISSSSLGYGWIETDSDFEQAVSYLDKKAAAIAIRKNVLLGLWNKLRHERTDKLQWDMFGKVLF